MKIAPPEPLTPVPIQQHGSELEMILDIYRTLQPDTVLEVGSLHGGTLYHWIKHAGPGATVVSVDLPLNTKASRQRWQGWADEAGVTLHAWKADSAHPWTIARVGQFAPYDFIFIDGDHTFDGVSSDFENYYPMLGPGGCMAFHDISAPDGCSHIDVGTWWRQLQATGRYRTEELVKTPAADTGGIGVIWKTAVEGGS